MAATFTVGSLKAFDGSGSSGKIYIALKGNVFDVTEKGAQFYGKGGPYAMFAGHDASRALATMNMTVKDTPDDISDLTDMQKDSLDKWETQFKEKYELVGKLSG